MNHNVNQSFLDGGLSFQCIYVIFYSARIFLSKQEGKNQVNFPFLPVATLEHYCLLLVDDLWSVS